MNELCAAEAGRAPNLACSGETAGEELCFSQQFSLVVRMQTKTARRRVVLQQVPHIRVPAGDYRDR